MSLFELLWNDPAECGVESSVRHSTLSDSKKYVHLVNSEIKKSGTLGIG